MRDKTSIYNIVLVVVAAILAAIAFSNGRRIGQLKNEMAELTLQDAEEKQGAVNRPKERRHLAKSDGMDNHHDNIGGMEIRQEIPKEDLEPPEPEEINRILARAKHDLEVSEAFKKETGSYFITSFNVTNKAELKLYYRNINMQIDRLNKNFAKLQELLAYLDFSAASDEDMETLRQYLALREKYESILYDENALPEAIIMAYREVKNVHGRASAIIHAAEKHTYGDLQEFWRLYREIEEATIPTENTVGDMFFKWEGKEYIIKVPEGTDDY